MRKGIRRKPSQTVGSACARALWQGEWKEGQYGWEAKRKTTWKEVNLHRWPFFKSTVLVISLSLRCLIKCKMPSFQLHNIYWMGHTYPKHLFIWSWNLTEHSLFLFASNLTLIQPKNIFFCITHVYLNNNGSYFLVGLMSFCPLWPQFKNLRAGRVLEISSLDLVTPQPRTVGLERHLELLKVTERDPTGVSFMSPCRAHNRAEQLKKQLNQLLSWINKLICMPLYRGGWTDTIPDSQKLSKQNKQQARQRRGHLHMHKHRDRHKGP